MVDLINHGIDLVGILEGFFELVIEILGHQTEKNEQDDGQSNEDSCTGS